MINKILTAIALIATLLITVACSSAYAGNSGTPNPSATEISIVNSEEFNQNPHIQKQIEVASGGQISITLSSNASTGFSWNESAVISDNTIVQQVKHESIAAGSDKVGAPGTEQWTLKAVKAGTTTVHLEYGRPWEGGEKAVWTLDVTVTVK